MRQWRKAAAARNEMMGDAATEAVVIADDLVEYS